MHLMSHQITSSEHPKFFRQNLDKCLNTKARNLTPPLRCLVSDEPGRWPLYREHDATVDSFGDKLQNFIVGNVRSKSAFSKVGAAVLQGSVNLFFRGVIVLLRFYRSIHGSLSVYLFCAIIIGRGLVTGLSFVLQGVLSSI